MTLISWIYYTIVDLNHVEKSDGDINSSPQWFCRWTVYTLPHEFHLSVTLSWTLICLSQSTALQLVTLQMTQLACRRQHHEMIHQDQGSAARNGWSQQTNCKDPNNTGTSHGPLRHLEGVLWSVMIQQSKTNVMRNHCIYIIHKRTQDRKIGNTNCQIAPEILM